MVTLPSLRLKPNADRRLRAGHLWVFSNEVDTAITALTGFVAGDQAILESAQGKALGVVALSPNNLICARVLARDPQQPLNKALLVHRLQIALSIRARLFAEPFYRLVFGDSDWLPGLIVDRFGSYLVVQISSATMERVQAEILEALIQVLAPQGILLKNDHNARTAEALPEYVRVAYGSLPDWVPLQENGVLFEAPLEQGQKTGWFYDHRINRARLAPYVRGKRVLDLFSYIGGWGVQAAVFGAREVLCVDASTLALEAVARNAALNHVAERVQCLQGDVFEVLRALKASEERFDVVICDPPAFIKRKKDFKNGTAAYRRLNEQAMRLLSKDAILVSASCSMHLPMYELQQIALSSARHLDRNIQILECGGQGPDHPTHPAIVETNYLKSCTLRLLPNS